MGLEWKVMESIIKRCPLLVLNKVSKMTLGKEAHANNPSIWKAEVKGPRV